MTVPVQVTLSLHVTLSVHVIVRDFELSMHVTVSVIVTLSVHVTVRDCDTSCACDMLPNSSGVPFSALLVSTGWICYSTLVPLPILGKHSGDTVPASPREATECSLPPVNDESVTASCKYPFTDSLTTLPISVTRCTRDTNGKNSELLLEVHGYNLG